MQSGSDAYQPSHEIPEFHRTLPEDCTEYAIYIFDKSLSDFEIREKLRGIQEAATTLTRQLLKGFIWQREAFSLHLARTESQSGVAAGRSYLQGRTNFGDSIDDEWLVVYLLRDLSRKFSDAWIRVVDNDGQFLLAEAANVLPKWLDPDIADNRVWLHDGMLLIIPLEQLDNAADQYLCKGDNISLDAAEEWILNPRSSIQHSAKIETRAFSRIQGYPEQISKSLQCAIVTIPRKLAYVLHSKPAYSSAAVEAFYLRDPIAMRPLRTGSTDDLHFPPKDCVKMSVKFTKIAFAQLRGQHFRPYSHWSSIMRNGSGPKARSQAESGMKVTSGFEMLLSDPQNLDKPEAREIRLLLEDLDAEAADLPSDADISAWDLQDDDESWLNINYEEFEKELAGKGEDSTDLGSGFGDKQAQMRLRGVVKQFEEFMEDGDAEPDESEDEDDDTSDDSDSPLGQVETSSRGLKDESKDVDAAEMKAAEADFSAMMRRIMEMPEDVFEEVMTQPLQDAEAARADKERSSQLRSEQVATGGIEGDSDSRLEEAMREVEQELREAGIGDLDDSQGTKSTEATRNIRGKEP